MRLGALALLCLAAPLSLTTGGSASAASPVSSASARDVGQADPLRKVLLGALRPTVERDLGQKVIFVVRVLRVQGDWAFADVVPQKPGGKAIDFLKTRHAERLRLGMFDNEDVIFALLRRKDGRWKVVTFAVAPTDVAWDAWDKDYGAPRALFALPPG